MSFLLHQMLDNSARRYPDRPAFRYEGQSISYEALRVRSNAFSHQLRQCGVERGDRVGLLLPKSLDLPVAVYGTLKAGAVQVPLDANFPAKRLANIAREAGIRTWVVSQSQQRLAQQLCELLPDHPNTIIGCEIEAENGQGRLLSLESSAEEPVAAVLTGDDPAYLLFTSGSTGEPKGILHSHSSGLAYARLAAETYGLTCEDRLGNFAPLHFDQSTFEFYAGPSRGCCTVMIPQAFAIAVESLAELIEQERLTVWYSVPSMLIQLLERGVLKGRDLSAFRWVLFGGEPFPPKLLTELMHHMPNAHFSNVYGPTEVNQCTFHHMSVDSKMSDSVPIGRTWANAEHLLLDEDDNPVADGDVGEYVVRTPTMMLGYWGNRVSSDVAYYYRDEPGGRRARFYRTGDLMKLLPDGVLEFHGRRDRQVKARGFRVELDEIESTLCAHESVQEAGSYLVKDPTLGDRVEAAVCLRSEAAADERQLKRHCAEYLPAYARPMKIHVLPDLPRTRTGKIDRAALARGGTAP